MADATSHTLIGMFVVTSPETGKHYPVLCDVSGMRTFGAEFGTLEEATAFIRGWKDHEWRTRNSVGDVPGHGPHA